MIDSVFQLVKMRNCCSEQENQSADTKMKRQKHEDVMSLEQ